MRWCDKRNLELTSLASGYLGHSFNLGQIVESCHTRNDSKEEALRVQLAIGLKTIQGPALLSMRSGLECRPFR